MTDDFLIDTNIIVYAYDTTEGRKHEIAREILEDAFRDKQITISVQNLTEFYNITTKKIKKPLSKEQAKEIIEIMAKFKGFKKIAPNENTILKAIDLPLPFWDAMIAATMLENNITRIYTENTKDFSIEGIKAVNPFE